MEQVGVRELRQHASRWLERVQAGESFEVTDRGRPVAMLVPAVRSRYEQLLAEGSLQPGTGDPRDHQPLPPVAPGEPSLSQILEDQREERLSGWDSQ